MEPTLTPVSMLCLQFVADSEAIRYFEGICRRLGIKEEVIIHAQIAHPLNTDGAPSRQFMSALKSWYDGDGVLDGKCVPNTFAVLCKALRDSRCEGVADKVMKHCKICLHHPKICTCVETLVRMFIGDTAYA